ncbi:uncharacterized protein BJ171DRAFT_569303 [Polychytrium aggregatum]|uniref:uncharacterized protein n=1 Tax=Polychytrium aggregatum TaxID=110093 RepID=UPI0022FDF9E3|nr:uncharacterized protein BJ171DRAFT_569303 [Polychytrium aggregatum]KAI9203059.1 hypothetical protein BJ171DRAFT_569303 [Polychytrium aggregatum]
MNQLVARCRIPIALRFRQCASPIVERSASAACCPWTADLLTIQGTRSIASTSACLVQRGRTRGKLASKAIAKRPSPPFLSIPAVDDDDDPHSAISTQSVHARFRQIAQNLELESHDTLGLDNLLFALTAVRQRCLLSEQNVERLYRHLLAIPSTQLVLTAEHFNLLLEHLTAAYTGEPYSDDPLPVSVQTLVQRLASDMETLGLRPDAATVSALILVNRHDADAVIRYFHLSKHQKLGLTPDAYAYIYRSVMRSSDFHHGKNILWNIYGAMNANKVQPNLEIYKNLLLYFVEAEDSVATRKVINSLRKSEVRWDSDLAELLVKSATLLNSESDMQWVSAVVTKARIRYNRHLLNAYLEFYALHERHTLVLQTFKLFQRFSIEADHESYQYVLHACAALGMRETLESLIGSRIESQLERLLRTTRHIDGSTLTEAASPAIDSAAPVTSGPSRPVSVETYGLFVKSLVVCESSAETVLAAFDKLVGFGRQLAAGDARPSDESADPHHAEKLAFVPALSVYQSVCTALGRHGNQALVVSFFEAQVLQPDKLDALDQAVEQAQSQLDHGSKGEDEADKDETDEDEVSDEGGPLFVLYDKLINSWIDAGHAEPELVAMLTVLRQREADIRARQRPQADVSADNDADANANANAESRGPVGTITA